MCIVQKGKVLKMDGKKATVLVDGSRKEVTVTDDVAVGDTINIFQTLGFKK